MRRRAAGSITLFGVANCLRYRFNPLARFERERVEFRVGRASDVATSASVSLNLASLPVMLKCPVFASSAPFFRSSLEVISHTPIRTRSIPHLNVIVVYRQIISARFRL
jgi:hypothetical protein